MSVLLKSVPGGCVRAGVDFLLLSRLFGDGGEWVAWKGNSTLGKLNIEIVPSIIYLLYAY